MDPWSERYPMRPEMIRRVRFAPKQRVLAVSDIHGCKTLLEQLLNKLDYRPGTDALVLVGDLLTKGEENMAMLEFAMELARLPDVHILLGNCDGMNDEAEAPWLPVFLASQPRQLFWEQCATQGIDRSQALADPHKTIQTLCRVYPKQAAFLEGLPRILESEQYYFAHAALNAALSPEKQDPVDVITRRDFLQSAGTFDRLLIVGHYPACNYDLTECRLSPHYDAKRNILCIDGGNRVKTGGQLNGAILQDGRYLGCEWVDDLPIVRVLRPQPEQPSTVNINWPNYEVQPLEWRDGWCRCRHKATSREFQVPAALVKQTETGWRLADDYTDYRPSLKTGQQVGLAARAGDWALIKTGDRPGWVPAGWLQLE